MAGSSQQLVRNARKIWSVSNERHLSPLDFERPTSGEFIPRWGTVALLRLAAQANMMGLTPVDLVLRDRFGDALDADQDEHARQGIIDALKLGDVVRAQDCLEGPRGPYSVLNVGLMAEDGTDFHVGQLGALEVSGRGKVEPLLKAARSVLNVT